MFNVPYCSLYDEGCAHSFIHDVILAQVIETNTKSISSTLCGSRYTSLGSVYNTWKNPALLIDPISVSEDSLANTPFSSKSDDMHNPATSGCHSCEHYHPSTTSSPSHSPSHSLPSHSPSSTVRSGYKPAYELVEEAMERAGRGKTDPTPAFLAARRVGMRLTAGL